MPPENAASKPSAAKPSTVDPRQAILDVAERLAQTRGFNGFSYADIAARLSRTKASLHHHFRSKAALGEALIERYRAAFSGALAAIEARTPDPRARLERYARLYEEVLLDERMCLCGMLAAEYATLPPPMQRALRRFFDDSERWLTAVIEEGRRAGALAGAGSARDAARMYVGSLEGAMLVARSYGEPARFRDACTRILAAVAGDTARAPARRVSAKAPARSRAAPRSARRSRASTAR